MVWRSDIAPFVSTLPNNIIDIWHYGFTEILNNAIDHFCGTRVHVRITKTAVNTEMVVHDDGEGIFKKFNVN